MKYITMEKNNREIYNKGIREEDHPVGQHRKTFRLVFEKWILKRNKNK